MTTRYQGIERDQNNAVVAGAKIYVLDRTGTTLQTLTDDYGNSLANPVTSDSLGGYYFNVATPNTYYLKHTYNGRLQLLEFVAVGVASDAIFKGDPGDPGAAGTLTVGIQTTGAAGSSVAVTNTGTPSAAILNFTIPRGDKGDKGDTGSAGTTGNNINGERPPGINVGNAGDTYNDSRTGYDYGQKTGGTWPRAGVADAVSPWKLYDFRYGGTLPSFLTLTRAGATSFATNLCYHDAPGASYQTFAANTPVTRTDLGMAIFPRSRNLFINSLAPVTQTITVPSAGVYLLQGNGTGTLTPTAGTAVGSGFTALALSSQNYRTITITTPGTLQIAVSGSVNAAWFDFNPDTPAYSIPSPLIITGASAVSRDADVYDIGGAFLTLLASSTGTLLFQTERLETGGGFGRDLALLGFNNNSELSVSAASQYSYLDTVNSTNGTTGTAVYSGRNRTGFAWSGTTMTFVGGDRIPNTFAHQLANGVAITSAKLGALDNATFGDHTLGGWLSRIEYRTDRLSDAALFAANTTYTYAGTLLNV